MLNTEPHLEVIGGTMFSGKTKELLRRLSVYRAAKLKTQLIKPAIDTRYSQDKAVTHDGISEQAEFVNDLEEFVAAIKPETDVVGVEEAQFFAEGVVDISNRLIDTNGKIIVASGLLNDYQQKPFKTMQELVRYADDFTQLKALCQYQEHQRARICGAAATRVIYFGEKPNSPLSSPLLENGPVIKVGGAESYSPRCRLHYKQFHS